MATRYNYTGQLITDGLVLNLDAAKRDSYPGSGTTWYDLSGNGNNGTLTNGPTYTGVSKDAAIVFDGVDDYVNISNFNSIPSGSSPRTYEIWFKTSTSTYVNQGLAVLGYTGSDVGQEGRRVSLTAGNTRVAIAFNGLNWGIDNINLSGWNHAVWTFEGSTGSDFKIYINTILQQSSVLAGVDVSVNTVNDVFLIGTNRSFDNFQEGNIPIFKIYNRALTADEISQNFNALRGRYGI